MRPKIDLHCHLDGSLSETTIRRLAGRSGISLPKYSADLIRKLSAPADCQSLEEYLECFNLPVACLKSEENLRDAAQSVIIDAAEEDVIYIELRFAPLLHTGEGFNVRDVIESVVLGVQNGVDKVKSQGKFMEAGVIVCGMRHMPVTENVRMLKAAGEFLNHGVCGVDIAGGEVGFPPMVQKDLFDMARDMRMPITIHAGECGSISNVLDAVALGASRIGHGIALYKDAGARRMIKNLGIILEICPVSNLQTKAIDTWENYPFRMFMDEGLKVTVNTDNRMVSQTSMANEFEQLKVHCGLTDADEKQILLNSIEGAFADDSVKSALWQYIRIS